MGGFHQGKEQVGDPHRRMDEILAEDGVVSIGDVAAEDGDDGVIDLILSEVTERLDEGAADPARRGHVSRSGVLEDDFAFADLHLAGWAVGQEDDAGWDLVRESEYVGSVGSRWLDADGVPGDKGMCDGIGGWGDRAKDRVIHGVVVESTGELADGMSCPEPTQAGVNSRRAAKIPKVLRSEYPTLSVAVNPATNCRIY